MGAMVFTLPPGLTAEMARELGFGTLEDLGPEAFDARYLTRRPVTARSNGISRMMVANIDRES